MISYLSRTAREWGDQAMPALSEVVVKRTKELTGD
jgi:hypothetical protein